MNEKNLVAYYNKFNEDKRLNRRHGLVEFITSMKYIHNYICVGDKVLDIGAGTGRYSISLADEGYDVTAVELVKHNLRVIESKSSKVKTILGNAKDLSFFDDGSFDLTLLFGPMYHLIGKDEKIQALNEAKRVTKKGGIIIVAYVMNDYAVIKHGFMENKIKDCISNNEIDANFHITPKDTDLYTMVTLDDINELNSIAGLSRVKIVSADGPANYIRNFLNKMDDDTFDLFIKYHLSTCERSDLMGACAHTIDILKNN